MNVDMSANTSIDMCMSIWTLQKFFELFGCQQQDILCDGMCGDRWWVLWLFCDSEFAAEPVHSGSGLAQDLADIIYDELWSLNLDDVAMETYQVLLSKLDMTKSNLVRVVYAGNDDQVVSAEGPDISDHSRHYQFAEYSPSANITVTVDCH